MTNLRAAWSAAVLSVAATGLTACGGGGHTLSKSEFIASADAICVKATADANALPQVKSPGDLIATAQKTADIVESTLSQLRALHGAPKDEAVLQKNLIAPTQAQLQAAKRFVAAATPVASDANHVESLANQFTQETAAVDAQSKTTDQALAAYGFDGCAKTNA